MSFNGFLTFVFFMMSVEYKGQVHGCDGNVPKTFARIGGVASFRFGNFMKSDQTFTFRNSSNGVIALMVYTKATNQTQIQTTANVTLQLLYNSNLEIQANKSGIEIDDKGLYNMGSSLGDSFCSFLFIFGKPQKPVLSHDNNNILGGNSQLSCSSSSTTSPSNHSLGFNYSWEVNDTTNPQNPRYKYGSSRKTFTILSVIKDDANKRFKCIAKESGDGVIGLTSDTSDKFIFRVIYGPDACTINSISPLALTEGESSPTVSCESDCYPSCSHTWSNVSSNSLISTNGQFQLVKATRYQAGNYKCVCRNTATGQYAKNQTAVLQIVIQYTPDVSVLLSTERIIEGNNLTISCDADGVPSDYNYNGLTQTWNGTTVPNTHREVSGTPKKSTLYVPSLQLQDTGNYTCYVNNGIKKADTVSSVIVKVKVLPKLLTRILQFTGKTDGTVNVSVHFYSFPDIQEVVFQRQDNQTITNGTVKYKVSHFETTVREKFYGKDVSLRGMQANMMISDLKQENFGSYRLILKNELGKTITPFSIAAESEPSAPTGFRYIFKAGSHSFTWHGGFNGGKLQTFIIQTSIPDQDNWQNITTVTEKIDTQNVVTYLTNVSSLQPGTYSARLFAWNVYGKSDYVVLSSTFTINGNGRGGSSLPVAAVIGGSLAAIAVFVAIAAISFLIYKRRFGNKGGSQSRLDRRHVTAEGDSDDEDEVNTVNSMYISADEVKPGLSAENTYSQPVKKKKQDIYAMVDKTPKKNGQKKDKEGKVKKATDGDIYENAPEKTGGTECRNAYDENPENSTATRRPAKNVNKEGFIYADLTFNDQLKGQKKVVIHGLDSMTEYVEVDFTKKAEPLPESDEEK